MGGPDIDLTKRSLLTATGAGLLGAVGVGQALTQPVSYNRQTVVEGENLNLEVGWKEWYNGVVQEEQATLAPRTTDTPPVVTLRNLAPGDVGKLAFGLTTTAENGSPPPARLQARVRALPGSGAENGITEPEAKAGDSSPDRGELGDQLDVRLWYDTGFTVEETPLFGHCDGTFDDTVDTELTRGPFPVVAVPADSDAWMDLDAHPNESTDCLGPNETLCLGLDWQLPEDVGNRIQSDGVAFAVEFRAVQCRGGDS